MAESESRVMVRRRNVDKSTLSSAGAAVSGDVQPCPNGSCPGNGGCTNCSVPGASGGDDHLDTRVNDDDFDADSKETRLTLMEEVLLLGLKDKEVGFDRAKCHVDLTLLLLFVFCSAGLHVILE